MFGLLTVVLRAMVSQFSKFTGIEMLHEAVSAMAGPALFYGGPPSGAVVLSSPARMPKTQIHPSESDFFFGALSPDRSDALVAAGCGGLHVHDLRWLEPRRCLRSSWGSPASISLAVEVRRSLVRMLGSRSEKEPPLTTKSSA